MPEEMPERLSDAEGMLLGRIENSIKNDGFPESVVKNYLKNKALSIPGLRFKMIGMLRTVEEPYAACYFDILADIELRCNAGEVPKKEIADLSQTYFQAVRSLSEAGYPAARIHELICQSKEETGQIPTPYALYSVLNVLQEEKGRRLEADRQQAIKLQEELRGLLAGVMELEQSLKEQLDRNGKQLVKLEEMENSREEKPSQSKEQALGRHVQSPKKAEGILYFVKQFIDRGKKGRRPPATLQELLMLLRSFGCSPAVMQEVQKAMEQGVPLDEIRACITEAYQGGAGEQMAADALKLFTIRQKQKNQKGGNA